MTSWFRILILSFWLLTAATARAQSEERSDVYIGHVALVRNWDSPASDESLIETFKHRLRDHGYETNDCKETKEAWSDIVAQSSGAIPYSDIGKKLVQAQQCTIPNTAKRAYSARLVLDYDPQLKQRQAVLYLLPLFGGTKLDGTYTHKAGAIETWYVVIDRVIRRAIGRYNENTALRVHVPKEAAVGDLVKLDGSEVWDPDGDAFELRWQVKVKACVGNGKALPRDTHDCPEGMKLEDWVVRDHAGKSAQIRELSVPMIGDYRISVHARSGNRDGPDSNFTLRAEPRRAWTFFARQGLTKLPTYFLTDRDGSHLASITGFGLERRFMHRLGLFGWYEEVHYGLSLTTMKDLKSTGDAVLAGLETVSRTLDRTGHYGIVSSGTYSVMFIEGDRDFKAEHTEWGASVGAFIGAYYAFGDNYIFQQSRFCSDVCPSVALGPTLASWWNITQKRIGISLGIEAQVGIEF